MNYRHIYHAGNFADVIKHLALVLCVEYLKQKEKGFFVLDAHGGCGLYDLQSEQAQKTKEYEGGIASLIHHCEKGQHSNEAIQKRNWIAALPAEARNDVEFYLSQIRKDWKRKHYPGSPLLIARMLRPQDRLFVNELHPEDVQALKANLGGFPQVRVLEIDAYQAIRAHIPPHERRGLVLIDPPFEKTDEFQTLLKQMQEWKKRWATGTYMIWYPVKPQLPLAEFYTNAQKMGFEGIWSCEYSSRENFNPEKPNRLLRAGLMLLNPPYQIPTRLKQTASLVGFEFSNIIN